MLELYKQTVILYICWHKLSVGRESGGTGCCLPGTSDECTEQNKGVLCKKLGLHLGYDDSLSSFAGHSAYLTFSLHPGILCLIPNALCCLGVKY